MELKDLIKMNCVKKGITVSQVEKDLGFSNGYLSIVKFPMTNYPRAKAISEKLGIPIHELIGGDPEGSPVDVFALLEQAYGKQTSEDIRMLLALSKIERAELRGEMRQMLRVKKLAEG